MVKHPAAKVRHFSAKKFRRLAELGFNRDTKISIPAKYVTSQSRETEYWDSPHRQLGSLHEIQQEGFLFACAIGWEQLKLLNVH